MEIDNKIPPIFILILLAPLTSYGQQGMGSLEVDVYQGGERADYHDMVLKIYQDNEKIPYKTIESLSGNPYKIPLPLGHKYKIEVYVSSMYASVGYVDLQNNNEKLELKIPISGSIRFTAVYNDSNTPIDNATVMIKSNNGTYEYWTNGTTDDLGKTIRFWLQPTILNDDYYVATVSIGNGLRYSYNPISILPGVSSDIKIITPWPATQSQLIVSVYKSTFQKVSKSDGTFAVELYDNKQNKIAESNVNVIGEAYFSNLKVGSYIFRAIDLNDTTDGSWGITNMIVDGKQISVQIFKNQINNMGLDTFQVIPASNEAFGADPISISQNLQTIGSSDLLFDIKEWNDHSTTISDSKLLSKMGIKANHIPSWVTKTAKWVIDGEITEQDFVNAIKYMHASGIIK